MTQEHLDDYELEDGEWEEGVVYVDEDGNEFMVEFVEEDDESVVANEDDDNLFAYDAVQATTDAANQIYREGASTVRELAQAGQEMKQTLDDVKELFNFKDLFK